MGLIHKLDQKVIDQIAAGEVVERPASVLKELLENSIDAESKNISIRIKNGGIDLIEVKDDGIGISKDDLDICLDSHSTSKISEIEDIDSIETLGFRGEALSSISSVSKVTINSKYRGDSQSGGYQIETKFGDRGSVTKSSKDTGTTISVEDIFANLPARRKYLKSPKTEYRKILDIFERIALINPQIRFVLTNDERQVYNLPAIKDSQKGTLHPQRVTSLIKNIEFLPVFFDGSGMVIGGFVGHPNSFSQRISDQYIFVNGRSIWDNGIAKSVSLGVSRYIPSGTKIPFVISLTILSSQVDVNVHPRKSEVRFANPYRVYASVEDTVKASLSNISKPVIEDRDDLFRSGVVSKPMIKEMDSNRVDLFRSGRDYDLNESMEFSKVILQDSQQNYNHEDSESFEASAFLGRYVVSERDGDLWIVDQHAAAERIRFEKLLTEYEGKGIESQTLLVPVEVDLSESDKEYRRSSEKAFRYLGFEFVDNKISAVPTILSDADLGVLVKDVINVIKEVEDFDKKSQILTGTYRDNVIATMACHSSLRANKKISNIEAKQLLEDLMKCENSYSCPHGRPIIWKLNPSEIDSHFNRT